MTLFWFVSELVVGLVKSLEERCDCGVCLGCDVEVVVAQKGGHQRREQNCGEAGAVARACGLRKIRGLRGFRLRKLQRLA
jgi:hypothetical protein